MRFGLLRGVTLAAVLMATLMVSRNASADGFHKTIPREVLAQDLNTGQPYFAPPVPWGNYAKDGLFDHFYPKSCGLCGLLHHGCKSCGGSGCNSGFGHRSGCGLLGKDTGVMVVVIPGAAWAVRVVAKAVAYSVMVMVAPMPTSVAIPAAVRPGGSRIAAFAKTKVAGFVSRARSEPRCT